MEFKQNLEKLHERVAQAVLRRGPGPNPLLIAVSKTQPITSIEQLIHLGVRNFAENYVQEFQSKQSALQVADLRWHFVGRLQSNKVKQLVGAALIHSLDRAELLPLIETQAAQRGLVQELLVQVNLVDEQQKAGVDPAKLPELLEHFANFSHVRCLGLMLIPPQGSPEQTRPLFAELRKLRDRLATSTLPQVRLEHLSMGMSDNFEVAIEEGATMIRVGTALFGPRIR